MQLAHNPARLYVSICPNINVVTIKADNMKQSEERFLNFFVVAI